MMMARASDMTGDRLRAIRKAAGMTQGEVAALMRVNGWRAVSAWETGERSISGPVSVLAELIAAGVIGRKVD